MIPEDGYGPPLCVEIERGDIKTLLTPGYRLVALTDTDPRVREGKRISLEALHMMADRVSEAGARFLVVIIPTKEYVFRGLLTGDYPRQTLIDKLVDSEEATRQAAEAWFRAHHIDWADTTPQLQLLLDQGVNPYRGGTGNPRIDGDGHPGQAGYRAIAQAVDEYFVEQGLLE